MAGKKEAVEEAFARVAEKAGQATGSFWAFSLALAVIVAWALTGPMFGFSETWQLIINTGTTIVTFLMVFIIQHAQNKENRALQLKLNELIAATKGASNRLIDVEDLTDHEIEVLYQRYRHLAKTARRLRPGARLTIDRAKMEEEEKLEQDAAEDAAEDEAEQQPRREHKRAG